jgi:hypothetical protein
MSFKRFNAVVGATGLTVLLGLSACAVTGVGVGYDGGYDYGGGFYEPYGYDYGGWAPGYRVGPPRGGYGGGYGGHGPGGGGPGPGGGGHPYHSAPPGHSMPSMPGRPRGH